MWLKSEVTSTWTVCSPHLHLCFEVSFPPQRVYQYFITDPNWWWRSGRVQRSAEDRCHSRSKSRPTRYRYHHGWRGPSRDPCLPLWGTQIDVLIFPCSSPAANWQNWGLSINADMWCLTQPGDGTAPDESLLNDKSLSWWRFITVLS